MVQKEAEQGGGIRTREFVMEDYEPAIELWKRFENIEIAEGDDKEDIANFIRRNHGLSRVAEEGKKMVGLALCGHDGRRGYIYHLAIDPAYQRLGVGKRLVDECLEGMRHARVKRALILVAGDNVVGHSFWQRCGWEDIPGVRLMGIDL